MRLKWRTVILIGAILACVGILLPNVVDRDRLPWPSSRFKPLGLGLDLQGGSHIVYSIDLDRAVDDRASEIRRDLESRFAADTTLAVKPAVKTPSSPLGAVTVLVPDGANRAAIDAAIHADYGDTIDTRECAPADGGGAICISKKWCSGPPRRRSAPAATPPESTDPSAAT